MIVIVGALIVLGSVIGGFVIAGGHPLALLHFSEFVIIVGAALGALVLVIELPALDEENGNRVGVLRRAADAMPGFGIVAAVLGIVITMASIAGPIEQIGEKVAAALVGTFLGIFISYGFMSPLAVNMDFMNRAAFSYIRCIAASVIGFANGMSPLMAVEVARRGLSSEVKPNADDLETMLKSASQPAK